MISHGVVSGALFLCVGVVYDQMHTREIKEYGGVVNVMPYFAAFFMLFTMASAGLPATSGFVGEILVIVGTYQAAPWAAAWAATGLILGAAYMLWLYRRVVFGEITNPHVKDLRDMNTSQWLYIVPLALGVLWLGIHPTSISASIEPSTKKLLTQVMRQASDIPDATADDTGAEPEQAEPTAAEPTADASEKATPSPTDAVKDSHE
jgi:NADH-quinone oxidoreductase subunit M